MNNINLKFNILIFMLILSVSCNFAFAGYDTYSAITVDNENLKEKKKEYIVTENDPDLPDFVEEKTVASFIKNKKQNFLKRRRRKGLEVEDVEESGDTSSSSEVKKEQIEIKDKNKFQINADKVSYDDSEGNVYAKGHVELISKSQGITLKADNAVLDKASQTIKLSGNVKIFKDGLEMAGQSLIIDLNEENILMDNPVAEAYSFIIHAQESYLIANDIQMLNGNVECTMKKEFPIIPRHFTRYAPMGIGTLYNPNAVKDTNVNKPKMSYRIDSKEIVITSYKDHNSLVMKDAKIYLNNHRIAPKSDIEIISDKEYNTIETNSLEIGTFKTFGTYVGYGFVNKLPKGQTLKIMPALTRGEGKLGVGLLARHRSRNSMLEVGYSSSTEKFVARGLYRFGNGFIFRYGRNAYIPEGFMGTRRPGYAAQLAFEKAYYDQDQKITFNHGTYAGLFSDYKKYGRRHYFSTTRFRYNMQLAKTFFEYNNKEQEMNIRFSAYAQASATLYGTGQTAGVVRIGPGITAKVKKLESSVGYFLSGIHGDSPFIFDKYRYGKSAFVIHQKLNLNNVFALGYSVTITPDRDNFEHDFFTEQRIYALIGPRDVKLALAYDFVRDMGFIDIMFILGSDNTKINFEKLTTKDIDGAKSKQDFYRKAKKVKVEEI